MRANESAPTGHMKFWIPWAIDALTSAVVIVFFFVGLADGSVSSFNIDIWITIFAALAVVLAGSLWLKSIGRQGSATLLVLVLAVPSVLCALFLLLFIVSGEKFI